MDIFHVSLVSLFVILVSLFLHFFFHKNKPSGAFPLPPGKTGWPLVGESLAFFSAGRKGHPEKFILDRIAKYSSQVFKTHLLGDHAAVFCGASANKFLFSNENKLVEVWYPSSAAKIFPFSTQSSGSEESNKLRKMLPNFLKPEALQRYVAVMDCIAQRHFADGWENKQTVLAYPLAKNYTFRLACRLFISVENPNHLDKFSEPFNLLAAGFISIPIDFPGTSFNKAIKASRFIREELHSIIKQRKVDLAEGKASPNQDILSHMLLTSDENGKFMVEMDIAEKIMGLLIGGHDTTSCACTFIVKFLAEYPEVYESVLKEQMEIAKSKAEGELLKWDDIQKMKYSWNVVCEVLRLAPPVQGSFRKAITDFMFNGFTIPKGWKIYWSANSTHLDPEYFPEPRKFDPSRFEGAGPAPYTFVPFGGGPRMCPGKEYARVELLVFVHNLVKRFRLEKVIPDEKIVVIPVPVPAKGLPIRLYPHKID